MSASLLVRLTQSLWAAVVALIRRGMVARRLATRLARARQVSRCAPGQVPVDTERPMEGLEQVPGGHITITIQCQSGTIHAPATSTTPNRSPFTTAASAATLPTVEQAEPGLTIRVL